LIHNNFLSYTDIYFYFAVGVSVYSIFELISHFIVTSFDQDHFITHAVCALIMIMPSYGILFGITTNKDYSLFWSIGFWLSVTIQNIVFFKVYSTETNIFTVSCRAVNLITICYIVSTLI
jgi:hypothetical protein